MSGKAGGIGSIVLGTVLLVAGVVSAVTPGGQAGVGLIIMGVGMIAGGAVAMTFQPQSSSQNMARYSGISMATAAEGFPVPVIFGTQKLTGNFMKWNKSTLHSEPIYADSGDSGGKGGDDKDSSSQIAGYYYYLSFEYGLCMGPVDAIGQVWSVPGELKMRGTDPELLEYSSGEFYKNINISSTDTTSEGGTQSGVVRVYRGTGGQNRQEANDPYQTGEELLTGRIKKGYRYKITKRGTSDFTTAGAPNNTVGTVFIATAAVDGLLDANNNVYEYHGLNHRNMCWAMFMDFKLGRTPTAKTYQFVIERLPAHDADGYMTRPNGTSITGFYVRGSADPNHINYHQANPAAMIYEILTNKVWGRGLDASLFNEASFVTCATFFYQKNIGMGLTVAAVEKMTELLNGIMSHVKMCLLFDGETIKAKCLLDPQQTAAAIQTITRADVSKLQVIRPLWNGTFNSVRAEFTDSTRNFKSSTTFIPDLANIAVNQGRSNCKRIQFTAFCDYNTARRQAYRVLRDMSYPAMRAVITMNRFKSQVEVGDTFRLIWSEYGANTVTAYFQVTGIEEAGADSEEIRLSATEDLYISPVEGEELTATLPTTLPWETVPDIFDPDAPDEEEPTTDVDEISPVRVIEIPPILTGGNTNRVAVLGERPTSAVSAINLLWKGEASSAKWYDLARTASFTITGTLLSDYTNRKPLDRSSTGLAFSLLDTANEGLVLGGYNLVNTPNDSMETLIEADSCYAVIGEEIILIGYVEKVSTNYYRARNIIRGYMGSRIHPHSHDDPIFLSIERPRAINADKIPGDQKVKWLAYPMFPSGTKNVGSEFYTYHYGSRADSYLGIGNRPLCPELISYSYNADAMSTNCVLRPRFTTMGAGTKPFLGVYNAGSNKGNGAVQNVIANLGGMGFAYEAIGVREIAVLGLFGKMAIPERFFASNKEYYTHYEFIPEEISSGATGVVNIYGLKRIMPPHQGSIEGYRIYAVQNGVYSLDYLEIFPEY